MAAGHRIVIFGWAQSVHNRRWVEGLKERGYTVKLISLGGEPIAGVETVNFPYGSKLKYVLRMKQAAREARAFRPDLIHIHYAGGFGLWGLATGFAPTIVSVWGTDLAEMSEHWFTRHIVRRVLARATWITATSDYLKRQTLPLYPDAASKLTVIPFGVAVPSEVEPAPHSSPVRICFLKGHHAVYGPEILLNAMVKVVKEIPDVELSMAGQGPLTPVLKELISDLQLQNNVRLVGFIDNREIYPFIRGHHFMVMPSLAEAFGVAAIEASACGRPVIASDVGGIPEVVIDGETGILTPPGDVNKLAEAILKLASDGRLRENMGKFGHRFVTEKYEWSRSLDTMTELYERLIDHANKNTAI
jgi:glycosyltransferase involved in cell wall biosynthesis